MKIETRHFGAIDVADERVIDFPEGLPGFASKRFTLVKRAEQPMIEWLQSLEEPDVALMTLDPKDLPLDYAPTPKPGEVRAVVPAEAAGDSLRVRVIVWAGDQPGTVCLNLFAPLFLNESRRLGMQVPLVGSGYSVREVWPPSAAPAAENKPESREDPEE